MGSTSTIQPSGTATAIYSNLQSQKPRNLPIWKKIWRIVCLIFQAIANLFRSKKKNLALTPQEKNCLSVIRNYNTLPRYANRPCQSPSKKGGNTILSNSLEKVIDDNAMSQHHLQKARKHLLLFGNDLAKIVCDVFFEKNYQSEIQKIQDNSDNYIQNFRTFSKVISTFCGHESMIISGIMQHKSTEILDPTLQKTLEWLLKNQNQASLMQKVLNLLRAQPITINPQHSFDDYLNPILGWLSQVQGDPQKAHGAFHQIFDPQKNDDEIIEFTLNAIVSALFEVKIEQIIQPIHKLFSAKLPDAIHRMILANSNKISELITNRAVDLLEKVPFPATIDKIFSIFNDQVLNYLNAEKISASIIEKAKKASNSPGSSEAIEKDFFCVISDLKQLGEQGCKTKLFFSNFSQHESSHPRITKLAAASKHQLPTLSNFKTDLKKSFYPEFAGALISLLLPKEIKKLAGGQVQETGGLKVLWNKLIITDEFKEVIKAFKEYCREMFDPRLASVLNACQDPILAAIEENILFKAQMYMKRFLVGSLQSQIDNLTIPERLNEFVADAVLIAARDLLLCTLASNAIYTKAGEFAPLFFSLIDKPKDKEFVYKSIKDKLFTFFPSQCMAFSLKDANISMKEFDKIVTPLVEKLHHFITLASQAQKIAAFTPEKATTVLQEYFVVQDSKVEKNAHDLYMKFFNTITFEIGQFGSGTAWVCSFDSIKNRITSTMMPALNVVRNSHEGLSVLICDAFRKRYLSNAEMSKIIFGSNDPAVSAATTHERMNSNFKQIGNLVYDLILQAAEQSGSVVKFTVSKILGGNSASIIKLISEVYHKCFGDPFLNYNLILQVHDVFMNALKTAADDA